MVMRLLNEQDPTAEDVDRVRHLSDADLHNWLSKVPSNRNRRDTPAHVAYLVLLAGAAGCPVYLLQHFLMTSGIGERVVLGSFFVAGVVAFIYLTARAGTLRLDAAVLDEIRRRQAPDYCAPPDSQ